ncbi:MAG: exodeoxyribonuclease III [Chthonomonas sp.]|nr:exodeoxyribonuclease III [Chthonomonas sp.]
MRIATFNANSVRLRTDHLLDWMAEHDPDVVCIQEIKCEDDKFPVEEFAEIGYSSLVYGQKARHGVAMLYRGVMRDPQRGFPNPAMVDDARLQAAEIDGVRIINTYVPNGTAVGGDKWTYKMQWLEEFSRYLQGELRRYDKVIWLGDINIARQPLDVYDSGRLLGKVGHHPAEFERLDAILEHGLADMFRKFNAEGGYYSFWEFVDIRAFGANRGWRIDHIYANPGMAELCTACWIDRSLREQERPSDHTIVAADFAV